MKNEQKYVALVPLLIGASQSTGEAPARIEPGTIFSLAGDEGINIHVLLASGAARIYEEPATIGQSPSKRRKAT